VTHGAHHDTVSQDIFPISLLCLLPSFHCTTPHQTLPPLSHWAKRHRSCQLHLLERCLDPKRSAAARSYLEAIVAPPLPSSGVPHWCRPSPSILWFDRHPGRGIGAAVRPGRDRERRRGSSSKTATTAAWRGLLQGPPKRCDTGATERQICATVDLRSDGDAQARSHAFNNGGKHPHPHRDEAPIWIWWRHARNWAGGRPRRCDLDLQRQPTAPPPSLRDRRPPPSSMPRSGPDGLGSV
jgi:hypothetical protein